MAGQDFRLEPAKLEDVPALVDMTANSFDDDRHAQMKTHGQEPFDIAQYTKESMPVFLKNPRCVVLKAVEASTGELMGVCNWGFRGFTPDQMPHVEGRVPPVEDPTPPATEEEEPPMEEPEEEASADAPQVDQAKEHDGVRRIQELTSADMDQWMEEVMPPGARCLYIVGLTVSPRFQRRGVGSALLRWGTNVCDQNGVFAWVHSSEAAWPMYEKCGFQVIRQLDLDLDEYAPCPPPNEGPNAKWGPYTFRYMKYFPKET